MGAGAARFLLLQEWLPSTGVARTAAVATGPHGAFKQPRALARWTGWPFRRATRSRRAKCELPLVAVAVRDAYDDPPVREPREPSRNRGPRTERDVANDVVFGVVAVELLFGHDRLDEEVGCAFQRAVFDPVMERLKFYADPTTPEARSPAKSWRLQDRILERQFSLSGPFTEQASLDLNMSHMNDPFFPEAQRASRAVLASHDVEATDDPVSSALIAWSSHNLTIGEGPRAVTSLCRTRPVGYGDKVPVSEWLLPVFVEHDRSNHAERMALLYMGHIVKDAGGRLHPDAPIKGTVAVYASHTPCISCLSVFCQFKQKLPGVRLWVIFDAWSSTRRWIDDGSAVEAALAAADGASDE